VENFTGTQILAALCSAELCKCNVATVTGVSEQEVISLLRKFTALGMVAHHKIQEMNYYRLISEFHSVKCGDPMIANFLPAERARELRDDREYAIRRPCLTKKRGLHGINEEAKMTSTKLSLETG
jgi:hypothetical protein